MRKTLAILLALALVLCMMPSAAFAGTDVYTIKTIDKTVFQYDGNDAGQAPVVTVQKSTDGGPAVDVAQSEYTLKYCTKQSDGSYSTASETKPKNAGDYKICVFVGASEVCAKEFTIKPYDFTGVTIAIENQTTQLAGGAVELSSFGDSIKFSRGTAAITSSAEIALINAGLQANMTVTGNRYTVSFSIKEGQTANYQGSVPPTSFDYVINIADSSIVVKDSKGTSDISQIVGGDYNNQEKRVQDLFTLYRTEGSTVKKLTYGTDYTFTCADTKNVGTHVVTIKGKGIYGGSRSINLVITGRNADTYVKADAIADQTEYTLHSVKPVLRDTGLGKILEEGKDYQIVAYNGTAGSKGYVTVAFIGNYSGAAKDIEFNVVSNEKNVETMDVYLGNEKLVGSSKVFTPAYMYRGVSLPVNGLVVYTDYANKKTLSTSYYSVMYEYEDSNGKTVSTTSPIDAKTYTVSIVGKGGYAGKKILGTYNIPKFDIKNTTISVSGVSTTATPTVTVKSIYDNITFVKDKDYTVTSSSYISNGKVLVTVTPTTNGNLGGVSRSDYYPVVAKSIASCRTYFANGRSSTAYTGSSIVVDVKVEDGYYNVLRERTDYTISYKLNGKEVYTIKDAGVYTIEIKGINGYTGTTSLTFTVLGTDISDYVVTLKEASVAATGTNQTPVISSVKKGVYSTLSSTDYTVSYQDASGKTVTSMSTPGTYKVVVTGKNGYTGSTSTTFRIVGIQQQVNIAKTAYKVYKGADPIKITASATGDGTGFTYVSSNPEVASVSATGVVTIHKLGRAKITVTTTGMKKYEPASDDVFIKVYPKKTSIAQKPQNEGKGTIRVRWNKQDDVTYYEVRYSRDSAFKSGTYLTKKVDASTLNYTTQSTKITGLKSNAKYYVKVRAVKVVTNDYGQQLKYYGTWSNWRSVKTK